MKQLDKLESTRPLKTPGILEEHKTIYKAFANPVLVVFSFSRDFQVLGKQLFSQELEELLSHFLTTLGVKGRSQLVLYKLLQQASSQQLVWNSFQLDDLIVYNACRGPSPGGVDIQQGLIAYLAPGAVLGRTTTVQKQGHQKGIAWVYLLLTT